MFLLVQVLRHSQNSLLQFHMQGTDYGYLLENIDGHKKTWWLQKKKIQESNLKKETE
jgi:hypothetical protein